MTPTSSLSYTRDPSGPTSYTGPIGSREWEALSLVWHEGPWSTSSNFAREYAAEVALLASIGWISVVAPDGRSYDRLWRVTARGFIALKGRTSR